MKKGIEMNPNTVIGIAAIALYPAVIADNAARKIGRKIKDLPAPAEVFGFGIARVERRRNY
jgi:hypothetical protein